MCQPYQYPLKTASQPIGGPRGASQASKVTKNASLKSKYTQLHPQGGLDPPWSNLKMCQPYQYPLKTLSQPIGGPRGASQAYK